MKKEQSFYSSHNEQLNIVDDRKRLLIGDNATSILEIQSFPNGDCIIINKNPVEGDDFHYINDDTAKMIILFLQQWLNVS